MQFWAHNLFCGFHTKRIILGHSLRPGHQEHQRRQAADVAIRLLRDLPKLVELGRALKSKFRIKELTIFLGKLPCTWKSCLE